MSLANEFPDFVSMMQPSISKAKIFIFPSLALEVGTEVEVGLAIFTIRASFSTICHSLGVNFEDFPFFDDDDEVSSVLDLFMVAISRFVTLMPKGPVTRHI